MFKLRAKGALLGLAAALALAGCAQIPEGAGSDPHDPWEKMNRNTFAFNQKFDSLVLRPIAKGYQWAVPWAACARLPLMRRPSRRRW